MGNKNRSSINYNIPQEPFQLQILKDIFPYGNSSLQEISATTLGSIIQLYGSLIIDQIQLVQSPIQNKTLKNYAGYIGIQIKHWDILVTFHKNTLFWRIQFSQDGLANFISQTKKQALQKRKMTVSIQTINSEQNEQITIKDIINIIDQIKEKKYNVLQWNCQTYSAYIRNQFKKLLNSQSKQFIDSRQLSINKQWLDIAQASVVFASPPIAILYLGYLGYKGYKAYQKNRINNNQ